MQILDITSLLQWLAVVISLLVGLLTLYNAARLRTGVLASSTYAFGAGMLSLSGGLIFLAAPGWKGLAVTEVIYYSLFIFGFILLGLGSFKIYQMSKIR